MVVHGHLQGKIAPLCSPVSFCGTQSTTPTIILASRKRTINHPIRVDRYSFCTCNWVEGKTFVGGRDTKSDIPQIQTSFTKSVKSKNLIKK